MKPGQDDDARLFRDAVKDVKPLAPPAAEQPQQRLPHTLPSGKPRPPPRARFTRADARDVLEASLSADADITLGDEMSFSRPGVSTTTLRKLRRGQFRVQAELDLHGLVVREAKLILRDFLQEALARNVGCIRIIHGKGLRSGPAGPVLKQTVSAMLHRNAHVVAFTTARQVDGGTGAVYVLLRPG